MARNSYALLSRSQGLSLLRFTVVHRLYGEGLQSGHVKEVLSLCPIIHSCLYSGDEWAIKDRGNKLPIPSPSPRAERPQQQPGRLRLHRGVRTKGVNGF